MSTTPMALENDKLRNEIRFLREAFADLMRERDALKAENAALREDKERLDWMEKECAWLMYVSGYAGPLREAIDAARKEAKP